MKTFEEAYQKAIKENGCAAGETFARSIFQAGADNLIDQASANGQKKYQQGVDFMKYKAIEVFKENCQNPKDAKGCKCELCVRWVAGHCELLDGFIEKLNSKSEMNAFDVIKQKGEYFFGDSLHYLIGVDKHGNYVCEVDGEESYCSSCIKEIVKELNAEFDSIGYKSFSEIHDCNRDDPFVKISSACETFPERDDFESCNNCGAEINVSVLFTCPDEIKRWIDEDIVIDEISDSDAYRIYTCITSEDAISRYPKLVKQLKDKLETIRV